MSRAGRPRKAAITLAGVTRQTAHDRYPCGKKRPAARRHALAPAEINRIVVLAKHAAADPILATPLGILRLQGELTDTQVSSGLEYAKLRGQADRVLGLPRQNAKSPGYDSGFEGGDEDDPKRRRRIIANIEAIDDRIRRLPKFGQGAKIVGVLDRVCAEQQHPSPAEIALLQAGLHECGKIFGFVR